MQQFACTALKPCAGVSSSTPKDSVAKQLLDSSAAVDVYFKGATLFALVLIGRACNFGVVVDVSSFTHDVRSVCPLHLSKQNPHSVAEGPETERSSDNLLCFPAEHTVYPMTVKTASTRFALKKRFSQFVTLDAQVRPHSMRRGVCSAADKQAQMRATFEGTASAGKLPELPAKA